MRKGIFIQVENECMILDSPTETIQKEMKNTCKAFAFSCEQTVFRSQVDIHRESLPSLQIPQQPWCVELN